MLNHTEAKIDIPYEFIKDPVYGYIRLYEHEMEIVDTPTFQRLRRIKQLPSAQFVYPGATHTRFSHSLGVMHLSGLFLRSLLEPFCVQGEVSGNVFQNFFFLTRLWGLTHDLGHGPFSHTFDTAILQEINLTHEIMSSKIVQEDEDIARIIDEKMKAFDIKPRTLAEYLGKSREEWTQTKTLGNTKHNELAFYYILKGFYSTDVIDFLLRDNLYTGAGYGNFDWQRLILSSHLLENEVALEKKSRDTLDAFLLSRLFSFKTIYYHRWSRVVDHVTKNFLTKAGEIVDFRSYANNVNEYRKLDDQSILYMNDLSNIPERKMLINRVIPFRSIDEITIATPPLPVLKEDYLTDLLSEELKNKFPREAYFVDTPYLVINTMTGEEEVCMVDMASSSPTISREPVTKTSWGNVPYSIWTIRLYLNADHKNIEDEVKKAFRSVMHTHMPTHV